MRVGCFSPGALLLLMRLCHLSATVPFVSRASRRYRANGAEGALAPTSSLHSSGDNRRDGFARQTNGCNEQTYFFTTGKRRTRSAVMRRICAQGGDASRNRQHHCFWRGTPPDRSLRWSLGIGVRSERSD